MNTLLLNIILAVLGLVLAIVSIGGETWKRESSKWYDHLTVRGWIAVFLLFSVAGLTVVKEASQERVENELLARIEQMRRAQNTVLTHEEYSLIEIGTSIDLLIERLGQPGLDVIDPNVRCNGGVRYLRWSDIGRNSVQVFADETGRVVAFSLSSNHLPVRYAGVTLNPWELWNPHPSTRLQLLSHGDARFFGFVDDLGSAAPNNYNTIFVGWAASREHIETIRALENFDNSEALNNENWEGRLGLTYEDFRVLQEELRSPKLGVFSGQWQLACTDEQNDSMEDPEHSLTDDERLRNLVFFTYSSFEVYEWWFLDHS